MLCRRQVPRCCEEQWCLPPETPPLPLLIFNIFQPLALLSGLSASTSHFSLIRTGHLAEREGPKPSVPGGIARNGYLQDCLFSIDLYIWKPECESVLESALPWSWKTDDADALSSRGWCPLTPKFPSCTGRQKTTSLLLSLLFPSRARGKQLAVSKQEILRKSLQEKLPT